MSRQRSMSWRDTFRFLCSCRKVNYDKSSKDSFCSRFVDARVFMPEHQELSRSLIIAPDTYGLPHEVVSIKTKDDFLLMAYLIVHIEQNYNVIPTIIFYHGNGGNIGDCLPIAERLFIETVCNILLVEYRGFGFSQGYPSEEGVYIDAEAALDFVIQRPDLDSHKIILYGISLGGAVAIDVASKEKYKEYIAALIIENTFASLEEIVSRIIPRLFKPLIKFIELSEKFPSARKISKISTPTLLLSGLKDNFIRPDHMAKLYVECGAERKKLVCFPDGEHLNTWTASNYGDQITEFLQEALGYVPLILITHKELTKRRSTSSVSTPTTTPTLNSKQVLSLREALEKLPGPSKKPKITTNLDK